MKNNIQKETTISEDLETNTIYSQPKKEKRKWIKYIFYLVIILIIAGLVLYFSLFARSGVKNENGDYKYVYENIPAIFSNINWFYFSIFFIAIILLYLISSFILFCFVRLYTRHYKYHQAVANQLVGTFYNDITPGANSGGQFAQVYTFKKQGIPYAGGASIMVMNYIVYQTVTLICGFISMCKIQDILKINTISISFGGNSLINIPIVIFVILGFVINASIIILMYFMSSSSRFHSFVINHVFNLLSKTKLVRNLEDKKIEIEIQVANFRIELRRLQSNIPFTILVFVLTFFFIFLNGSLPALSGYALNAFDQVNYNFGSIFLKSFDSFCYMNFQQMISGLIPLPGGAGVTEFVFNRLFTAQTTTEVLSNPFFTNVVFGDHGGVNILMLFWRFSTFYIPFILCGVFAACYKSKGLHGIEMYELTNPRKTFATIQMSTYNERKRSSDSQYQTSIIEREKLFKSLYKRNKKKKTDQNDDDKGRNE